MAYTVAHPSDVEATQGGLFRGMGEVLGATSVAINHLELAPNAKTPAHDHLSDGREEMYVIISGSGTLRAGGEETEVLPGHYVFCSPDETRQLIASADGLTWVTVLATGR
jgi:quercetin dioxygenase-like cupin family protein